MKRTIGTEIICRTFNECGSVKKTAEILGMNLRVLQKRIKNECRYKLEPGE